MFSATRKFPALMERKKVISQWRERSDRWFAAATMKHVKNLAVLVGKNNLVIIGKNDEAHIPASNKQCPILMTMEYPVTLPDQAFVASINDKLLPSVYATREIKRRQFDIHRADSCYHTILET